jgi:bacterioferritin-associated ferredoxin
MNVTFAAMHKYAQRHGCGFEELRSKFGCGRGCALCVPYIKEMLRSGQTSFPPDAPPPEVL